MPSHGNVIVFMCYNGDRRSGEWIDWAAHPTIYSTRILWLCTLHTIIFTGYKIDCIENPIVRLVWDAGVRDTKNIPNKFQHPKEDINWKMSDTIRHPD